MEGEGVKVVRPCGWWRGRSVKERRDASMSWETLTTHSTSLSRETSGKVALECVEYDIQTSLHCMYVYIHMYVSCHLSWIFFCCIQLSWFPNHLLTYQTFSWFIQMMKFSSQSAVLLIFFCVFWLQNCWSLCDYVTHGTWMGEYWHHVSRMLSIEVNLIQKCSLFHSAATR